MNHAVQGHQDRQVIVKSSDKLWSTGGVNSNPLQYSCHKDPMNSKKKQKDMTLEDEQPLPPPILKVSNMLLGKSGGQFLIAPERMKHLCQSRTDSQSWMCMKWSTSISDSMDVNLSKLWETVEANRSFRYDLNQIPYDYTVEVRNRFKGLDLIDRAPEELWTSVHSL